MMTDIIDETGGGSAVNAKSLEHYLKEFPVSTSVDSQVFLGGSCNPTKWRFEIAIPLLSEAGITYFNPQVPDWNNEFKAVEEIAKQKCDKLLFVIDTETRSLYSCLEIVDMAHRRDPKDMFVVINDLPGGTEIQGQVVEGREHRDIKVLRDGPKSILESLGIKIYLTIEEAIDSIIRDIVRHDKGL